MRNLLAITLTIMASSICPSVSASEAGELKAVRACLSHWDKNPFGTGTPEYRVISAKVKVLGIGGDLRDENATAKPELILVKPNVNVLSKDEMFLMNPNGWYCIQGKVAVLGKTVVNLHCKAKLTASSGGATVMGGNENEDGVTVLGSSTVKRVACGN